MKIKERRPLKKKQTKEKTINRVLLGLIVFLLAVIVISSI
ncbi:TPA: peptidase, partial [Enterococcus faecium]|nr:peptidase [Enterococcus faecium]